MQERLAEHLQFTRGLGFKLAMFLSIAILPIGLISLIQTMHLSGEAERAAEIAIVGRTSAAAAGERALLQGALGTADALGPAVLPTLDDDGTCARIMSDFVDRSATYASASFVQMNGISTCTSEGPGVTVDFSQSIAYERFVQNPSTQILPVEVGVVSGKRVVTVSQPLYRDRELLGFIIVAVSHELLRSTHSFNESRDDARIVTFNYSGDLISADDALIGADYGQLLPRGETLQSLAGRPEATFSDTSNEGEERVFAIVSVVPGLVYALGSWRPETIGVQGYRLTKLTAIVFPITLWAVSLGVAYFAVYRLVLRHIRELRGQMRRFAVGDRSVMPRVIENAPAEIEDVSRTFKNMARILSRDEIALEEALDEKNVLLKEVHHRVKNNLQLIASIINMQSRVIEDEDAKRVLRSVQDRVSSLATIYRNLYQAERLDTVEADRLIADIIDRMVNAAVGPGAGLRVETQLDPLTLMPDQAVPLTLLTTEAVTNAVKYAGIPEGAEAPWVKVTLKREQGRAEICIANSMGATENRLEGTGLGSQLIEAFAMQLDGEAEISATDSEYVLRLAFAIDDARSPPEGAPRDVVLTSTPREGARH
ncbi:MAG: histidine kinase dimerization/phosphoacceptor domain -containing protein [Paracoccus sp. (in: a-proteobacteria)]|nr:histidine kinase dimerization/phosphoacceptor domain -containing protein [Paracoccus sp. (in: a-proteobacteria)]